ncbi:MAG TPA: VacJ family lipoprotein [Rubrivivax sp.]|nr:VacJ family lipoprotein [Rubrivivax sp.]
MRSALRATLAATALALAAGCASVPGAPADSAVPMTGSVPVNPVDPWERWNRKVFAFNEAIDEAVVEPVARAWRDHVPQMLRTGVSNFFGNIADIWSTANHFLQGKVGSGMEMGMRVLTNTLFGLGGILDPATEMRMPRRSEDFGQTLGVWGLPAGPYVVLPLLGPSSVRDAVGVPLDRYAEAPSVYLDLNVYASSALQLVSVRAELLATTRLVGEVALDKYSFVRDAYLARRRDLVFDGAPPLETFQDDFEDDPPPAKAN